MIIPNQVLLNYQTWNLAKTTNSEWLSFFGSTYPNVKLGCTFTPEKYPNPDQVKTALRFVLNEMGMRKIRFPIRWVQSIKNGRVNLDYYSELFSILSEYENLELCLNLGPIKTTDWPEVHVPKNILDKVGVLPRWPHGLQISHPLVEEASVYLHQLLHEIIKVFTPRLVDSVKILQLNNEAWNPFGENRCISSSSVEEYLESIALEYLPGREILVNSNGLLQARSIIKHIAHSKNNSIFGVDYYYHTQYNDYPLIRIIEPFALGFPIQISIDSVTQELPLINSKLEFTEVQIEKWGGVEYTGNSSHALKYVLQRCARYKPQSQSALLLRLWGVELLSEAILSKNNTTEQNEMLNIIQSLNNYL